jgi:hypothetical protein
VTDRALPDRLRADRALTVVRAERIPDAEQPCQRSPPAACA